MPILHAHPAWCSTEACVAWSDSYDHRTRPMSWKPDADNYWLTVSLTQYHEVPPGVPAVGDTHVLLGMLDLDGLGPNGERVKLETDLTAQDARLLAAALIAAAEQVESLETKTEEPA